MSIDDKVVQISKKKFEELLSKNMDNAEDILVKAIDTYRFLIDYRKEYVSKAKDYRIKHVIKNNIISYNVQEKKMIGYK